jgi:CDP-diacylglycerol--serine O-phosphatidyltransferase
MEDFVPRAPWQRRRVADRPRSAGRRWARLRRSGSLARQVLVGRVVRRRPINGVEPLTIEGDSDRRPRFPLCRQLRRDVAMIAPVSPAVPPPSGTGPAGAGGASLSIPLLPGERTIGRRLRFAVVNGCTLSSLVLGISAIFLAMHRSDVRLAAFCLIACVVFDGLDGALARKLGVASPFGAQMDSLADMCSFGIAAPVVVYAWLAGSAPTAVIVPACALVAVCAAIRLARFNVSPKDGRFFCGVPTTLAAAVLALGTLLVPEAPVTLQVGSVVLLAIAMVSSFPYVKLARVLRLPPWMLALPVVAAFVDYRLTFGVVVIGYLLSGPVLWLKERRTTA